MCCSPSRHCRFDIAGLELYLPLQSAGRGSCWKSRRGGRARRWPELSPIGRARRDDHAGDPATWRLLLTHGWRGQYLAVECCCGGERAGPRSSRAPLAAQAPGYALELLRPDRDDDLVHHGSSRWQSHDYGHRADRPSDREHADLHPRRARSTGADRGGGEIYIGGAGVARGYLNRPELTAERFIADPFSTMPTARMYRTGDLGRWIPDGNIEYLGRNDFQVKIRGFRIELGEIEARLVRHAGVREAVVLAREDCSGDKRLVAYVTAQEGAECRRSSCVGSCWRCCPSTWSRAPSCRLESLPLTPNGKLDRKALPAPDQSSVVSREYEAPAGRWRARLRRSGRSC